MNKIQKGLLLFHQAHSILEKDFERAFSDKDWNIAVRRAQESMEFAVKAIHLIVGEEPYKNHEPNLNKLISRMVSSIKTFFPIGYESDFIIEHNSYRIERDKSGAIHIYKNVDGVLTELAAGGIDLTGEFQPFALIKKDGIAKVFEGGQEVLSTSDSFLVNSLNMTDEFTFNLGVLRTLPKKKINDIDGYVSKQSKQRNKIFYLEDTCGQEQAKDARNEAWFVLRIISQYLKEIGLL